ncbi:MAG: MerR family transcriptional regulator [Thermodesulfobacteriota bacterium]
MNGTPGDHSSDRSAEANGQEPVPTIPDKTYFRIGEVCEIAGLKQHVLRYWETEFKELIRPRRATSKQRLYRREDVETILRIKKLLREEGFTIPGARKVLRERQCPSGEAEVGASVVDVREVLAVIKKELQRIERLLRKG